MSTKTIAQCLLICLLVALISACQPQLSHVFPTSPPAGYRQLLITFKNSATPHTLPGGSLRSYRAGGDWVVPLELSNYIQQLEQQFALQRQKAWQMESIEKHCVVFTIAADSDLKAVLNDIKQQPFVDTVQLMQEFEVMTNVRTAASATHYNDTHARLQYGEHLEQLSALHELSRGQSVKIGVLDTVSDIHHPDLLGQVAQQYQYVAASQHQETHGTAIAGIIVAKANNGTGLVGLAPDAQLYVYGACESQGNAKARCNSFNVLQGLEQAIKDGVQVLNLSIAGPRDDLVEQVLEVAIARGMLVVASINPERPQQSYPALMPGVIGVAEMVPSQVGNSTDLSEQFGDWLARSEKLSTLSGGGYQFFYGSSIATASVTGIAALLRSRQPAQSTSAFVNALARGDCDYLYQHRSERLERLLQKNTTCMQTMTVSHRQ